MTNWEDLSRSRKRVAKTISHVHGPSTFERPELRKDVKASTTVEDSIDDKYSVLTSLKYTTLLNGLVEDGYLVKEYQGGKNPIILDLEYDKDRDNTNAAPYGNASKLHSVVDQVLDREGMGRGALGNVNSNDFNGVRDAVNRTLGRTVLVTVSEASEYRFTPSGYSLADEMARDFEPEEDEDAS
ncbi:hypothetical protein SAMN04487950_4051 [Halogranum rubrum]|uniref:Uncharacterized protein n=1 Tax=Halogranum rubrum TaxID=553466 RepID=A0A1I4I8V0_9EURY|nr:hypothetical protein [Halogranum rubrum]SFL50715.1 hypothetical protein SAMN04487950_4051 [Halogranum rubrum]